MNTKYRILWIDDTEEYVEATSEIIEDIVSRNYMIPEIHIYNSYEDFRKKELEPFDEETFNLYDQVIVDYALSDTTGDQIIRELRSKNIFIDIVFYSSNYENMKAELRKGDQLDGVFCEKRENLTTVVDRVIKKNLKREYSIANIRGLIMDGTSDFDYICRTATTALFEKIDETKQAEIIELARGCIKTAQTKSERNFEDLGKKEGALLLKAVMNSVEYVMDNKDRYRIMSQIIDNIDSSVIEEKDFPEIYQSELIKPRNDLAHGKLYYGECKKKIHIAKTRQQLRCDNNCEKCSSKYGIEQCEHIRERMYSYYRLFERIDEKTNEILK